MPKSKLTTIVPGSVDELRNLKPVGAAWWEVIRDRGGSDRKYVSYTELFSEDLDLVESLGLDPFPANFPPEPSTGERDWVEIAFVDRTSGVRRRIKLPTALVDAYWERNNELFAERSAHLIGEKKKRADVLANILSTFTGYGAQDWPPLGDCLDRQSSGNFRQARTQGWYWLASATNKREQEGFPCWLYD